MQMSGDTSATSLSWWLWRKGHRIPHTPPLCLGASSPATPPKGGAGWRRGKRESHARRKGQLHAVRACLVTALAPEAQEDQAGEEGGCERRASTGGCPTAASSGATRRGLPAAVGELRPREARLQVQVRPGPGRKLGLPSSGSGAPRGRPRLGLAAREDTGQNG